jgi:hypothetical protein
VKELQHEANAAREVWLAQTQLVAAAQSDRAGLIERVRPPPVWCHPARRRGSYYVFTNAASGKAAFFRLKQ